MIGVTHANAQASLPHAQVGLSYTFQVSTTPAAPSGTIYSATGLPIGLSINSASGLIAGTPTTAGTYNGTISLTSGGVTNSFTTLLVVDPALGTPVISSATTASATVGQAFTYSVTASNSPTSFNLGALPAGLAIGGTATAPTISGTPTVAGTFNISLSANNNSGTGATKTLILTISPAGPVPAITSATTALATPGSSFTYTITASNSPLVFSAGGLPAGLSVNATTGVISGTPAVGGAFSIALNASNNNGTGPTTTLSLAIGTSAITSALSATGGVGVPFTYTITADRSPISFNVKNAPAWLTVNSTTGVLSGTPTAVGTASIEISANNAAGPGVAKTLALAIGNLPLISSASSASATVGTAFSYTITASNSPTSFAATGLPGGLSLNPSSGVISGVPTAAGTFSATLTASNGSGTGAPFTLLITIAPAPGNGGGGNSGGGGGGGGGPSTTPPIIAVHPTSQSVTEGSNVSFTVVATGALTYQWSKDGFPLLGAAAPTLTLANVKSSDAGSYTVTVTNFAGSATSNAATLTVTALLTPPVFAAQPANQTVAPGAAVTLAVMATGNPAPTYQWKKDGTIIGGATLSTLTFASVKVEDAGAYTVVATNSQGSATSSTATLTVTTTPTAPTITTQPSGVMASVGQPASFTVVASGVPTPTYQWQKNNAPIAGATGATLNFTSVEIGDAGSYDVVVSNSAGSVRSERAVLAVAGSRIVNFSVRANAGSGDQTLIVGFNVGGSGAKQALVRAVGPTLIPLGVRTALADPQLRLFNGTSAQINQNDDWGGAAALNEAFARAGAFALPSSSKDAALSLALDAGGYSAHVSGAAAGSGVVLVETYDVDGPTSAARLANLSARNQVGTGENVLIAGFVVAGDAPKTLLIRGVGPTLAQFGVGGALADPQLTVFDTKNAAVAQNDNWGGAAELAAAFTQAGAFNLPATSRDAALLVTLPPGAYTVQLNGANNGTGVGLIELYETEP